MGREPEDREAGHRPLTADPELPSDFRKAMLDQLKRIERRVESLANHADYMYARESDCSGRHERENAQRHAEQERIWRTLHDHGQHLHAISEEIKKIRESQSLEAGKRHTRMKVLSWFFGVCSAVLAGLVLAQATGQF